jgi:hypothetical protein
MKFSIHILDEIKEAITTDMESTIETESTGIEVELGCGFLFFASYTIYCKDSRNDPDEIIRSIVFESMDITTEETDCLLNEKQKEEIENYFD